MSFLGGLLKTYLTGGVLGAAEAAHNRPKGDDKSGGSTSEGIAKSVMAGVGGPADTGTGGEMATNGASGGAASSSYGGALSPGRLQMDTSLGDTLTNEQIDQLPNHADISPETVSALKERQNMIMSQAPQSQANPLMDRPNIGRNGALEMTSPLDAQAPIGPVPGGAEARGLFANTDPSLWTPTFPPPPPVPPPMLPMQGYGPQQPEDPDLLAMALRGR